MNKKIEDNSQKNILTKEQQKKIIEFFIKTSIPRMLQTRVIQEAK